MLKSVSYEDEKMRNILIKISLLCAETEICSFLNVFDDLKALFDRYSPDLQDLFQKAEFTTVYCKKIDVLKLSSNDEQQVIRDDQSFIKKNQLQRKIDKGSNFFSKVNKNLKQFFEFITGTS